MALLERTIPYKTYIKQTLVEGIRGVFNNHPDNLLKGVNATIEFPNEQASYPAVIVRFFEREIHNAGVGHYEVLTIDGADYKFMHYLYTGDIEFAIHALSSYDRDLVADSLVQTLTMGSLAPYTRRFGERIYPEPVEEYPKSEYNYIALNTDRITGFGETQTPAPWQPEDVFVYQTSYRCGVSGEFYSLPPETSDALGYVEQVNVFPWILDIETRPDGTDDPAEWQPDL